MLLVFDEEFQVDEFSIYSVFSSLRLSPSLASRIVLRGDMGSRTSHDSIHVSPGLVLTLALLRVHPNLPFGERSLGDR